MGWWRQAAGEKKKKRKEEALEDGVTKRVLLRVGVLGLCCSFSHPVMAGKAATKKPSAEEIEEKRRQRAEKKQREAERRNDGQVEAVSSDGRALFTQRKWVNVRRPNGSVPGDTGRAVRMLSWNILAQGLVRRKLFPGSDCLKWKEREAGLRAEMTAHDWDVGAFQEVDKIEVHGPNLERSGRRYLYAKGYAAKQHGLMIAWRVQTGKSTPGSFRLSFQNEAVGSKVIYFDQECVGAKLEGRKGLSRVTRNIALIAALASTDDGTKGIIVATTHLFWHPMHAYERVRQTGILKRAILDWRKENNVWKDWPIVLAGDFNDQPHSATYRLMTGEPLTLHNWEEVKSSSVVHASVDEAREKERSGKAAEEVEDATAPDEAGEGNGEEGDEGEGEGEDDQMLKNCRHATPEDGLLSFGELIQLHDLSLAPPSRGGKDHQGEGRGFVGHQLNGGLLSAYGSFYGALEEEQEGNYFGSSGRGRERYDDPHWTADTPNPHLGPCKE